MTRHIEVSLCHKIAGQVEKFLSLKVCSGFKLNFVLCVLHWLPAMIARAKGALASPAEAFAWPSLALYGLAFRL